MAASPAGLRSINSGLSGEREAERGERGGGRGAASFGSSGEVVLDVVLNVIRRKEQETGEGLLLEVADQPVVVLLVNNADDFALPEGQLLARLAREVVQRSDEAFVGARSGTLPSKGLVRKLVSLFIPIFRDASTFSGSQLRHFPPPSSCSSSSAP